MKIFVVVVTYNRLNCLKKVVAALGRQTSRFEQLVIVNNSSTDGTDIWLKSLVMDNLIVLNQANLGGAGGFSTGVKYAYENGADWIWMMDDDVYPNADCLENILKWTSVSECIQPIRFTSDNKYVESESYLYPKFYHVYSPTNYKSFSNGKNFVPVNVGCFEGMFISRRVVSKIGFPDSRFFIGGDDVVYGFAASFYTNPILIVSAKMMRERSSNVYPPVSSMYLYYQIRNFHLINEYLNKYNGNNFDTFIRYVVYLCRSVLSLLRVLFKYPDKIRFSLSVFRGVYDCFAKKIGSTY